MKLTSALWFTLGLAAAGPAFAGDVKDAMEAGAEAQYDAAKDTATRNVEAARDSCGTLSGDARDACMKRAEGEYDKAKSEERAGKARAEATEEQMKADYERAKERCGQYAGNTRDTCIEDAKATFGR